MIFNSVTFFVYLVIALALYYALPGKLRLAMLFGASIVFYGFWRWDYVWLMMYSIVLDFICALLIENATTRGRKRFWLGCSLVGNLGVLFYFKYLLLCVTTFEYVVSVAGLQFTIPHPDIILPLGISFYTFHGMSYSFDVYRGFIKAERDFLLFGTYVTFFPQLVAGPILRAREVMPYLVERPPFALENLIVGGKRIINGLFLKVVVADNLAEFVDMGFAIEPRYLSAIDVWTLAFLFGFQIYFDFSGYSQIALGAAKMMGIVFPENFNFPYFSTSPREFWKRWHISLSSWIRDYLYLPLCGVQVRDESVGGLSEATDKKVATRALFLTWSIMGMWHGANWTFLYWGVFHATWIYVYRMVLPPLKSLPMRLRIYGGWVVTLLLAMASWIPFRSETLSGAFAMHSKLLNPWEYLSLGMRENTYIVAAMTMLAMCIVYIWHEVVSSKLRKLKFPNLLFDAASWGLQLALVFVFLRPVKQFIYFQF